MSHLCRKRRFSLFTILLLFANSLVTFGQDGPDSEHRDHQMSKSGQMDTPEQNRMDHQNNENESMNHEMDHNMNGAMNTDHGAHQHSMMGMVMNANTDRLPEDCSSISRDYEFTVEAGTEFALPYWDNIFGMSQHEWQVEPCSRVTVVFKNQDQIRHQWMVHGLPRYIYDQGMFHIEAMGGQTLKGTFIVPSDDRTYLVHCDVAQHMEKGMKGQLVVGAGDGDLWSIPGLSSPFENHLRLDLVFMIFVMATSLTLTILLFGRLRSWHGF